MENTDEIKFITIIVFIINQQKNIFAIKIIIKYRIIIKYCKIT